MINIGIIGAGRIGRVHGESITKYVQDARVKAIADPFLNDQTKAWAKSMGIEECYTDYKKILEDSSIEAVLICASTDQHSPLSIEALAAGKHVFCEKPIDHDVDKIKAVLEAVKTSGKKYQVGFNRRFDHNFKAIHEAVAAGKVGKQQIIKITSRDPEPPSIDYVKVSGGIFLDMTIHDFDMVRYLSGSEVVEVYAEGSVTVDPKIGEAGDVDTAVITLKLANGATAVIDNCRAACYGYDQRAEVFGDKGCIAISNDSNSNAVFSGKDGVVAEKPMFFFLERYMQAYASEVEQFVDAIVNDKEVPVNANDGLQPVLIGLAAKKSVEEHRPVKISEISASYNI
ncbi:inositol 2-dehydrogenase [Anaerovibrio sp.]|jgi:myo-inositol 2-dehydrogenase/D-chiro-inositol 1-dehydrogenase|uniref:inositol 2-dehydrogenase n=1 Tax=Anaerovibrio sp. TaxID=1872532 RepID=UPI001B7C939D|nr:inositol 2-dehydrogenase [Anaerovibrio sp.]MBP3231709.1 inositol 2-dehydrogenase [Anaerovibrio sp.]MBR2142471.1 inositol 2-dehydrogenase [Anaerovibrio sp.]